MSDRFVTFWCSPFDVSYQVQVEYWGEGSAVELAGSFNGWKHFVVMKARKSVCITFSRKISHPRYK